MSTNSSDFQVTGCCLVTFVCYSKGEMRKCLDYDLRRTSIFPQREKGSNILATVCVCQWVQALPDFQCICRMTTGHLIMCVEVQTTEFDLNFTFIYGRYAGI